MPIVPYVAELNAALTPNGVVANVVNDPQVHPEDSISLPGIIDPIATWMLYDCYVEVFLDAGMALHKPLPQTNPFVDTLGIFEHDDPAMERDLTTNGTNLVSFSQATDLIQRMASSTYHFALKGQAVRIAYQIPIPRLLRVGQVPAVPEEIQRGYNKIIGNFCGIPLFYATWELHYMIASPLGQSAGLKAPVPPNLALHIRPDAQLPLTIKFPRVLTDQNSVRQSVLRAGRRR